MNESFLFATHHLLVHRLATHQAIQRQYSAYTEEAMAMVKDYKYGDVCALSETDAEEMARQLQVGISIVLFNADRFRGICCVLLAIRAVFQRDFLRKADVHLEAPTFNSKQMVMALEFFLQMESESSQMPMSLTLLSPALSLFQ